MNWQDPVDFEAGNHGNKPFSIRIPALVVTRGKIDRLNFLTAMWFTPTGAEPSRMVVAIQKRTLTYDYLLERGEFVMSAPTDKMMDIVVFGGYVSGRDVDKWQAAGLTAVRPSKISVPLIGDVPARGRTSRGLGRAIAARLGAQYIREPQVTVDIAQNRPFFILGEVRNAGQYPYVSGMTVQEAVAIAGGYGDRASERRVQITRRFNGIIEKMDVPPDYVVQPGDTLYVYERWF